MDMFQQWIQIYLNFWNDTEQNLLQYPKDEKIKTVVEKVKFLRYFLKYNE
jgi:hypothetical protein